MESMFEMLCRNAAYADEMPSSLDAVIRVPEMADFFTWLGGHVGKRNILAQDEIQTHRALQEASALIEDETELCDRYDALFTGETSVYPHSQDLPVLESTRHQLEANFDAWEQFEKKTRSLEEKYKEDKQKPVEPAVQKLLASEKRKIDDLVPAQLDEISALASSADRLRFKAHDPDNPMNVFYTVAIPSAELLSCMEMLNEYSTNLINHSRQSLEQHYSHGADDAELKLVFNECIRLQRIEILLEAKNNGIEAVLEAFANRTWFEPRSSCISEVSDEEIESYCHHKAKLAFCKEEVNLASVNLESRRRILNHLDRLADVVEPLRLCGDSLVRMAKSTRRWMKKVDLLHSRISERLEEACARIRVNRESLTAAQTMRKFHDSWHQSQKSEPHGRSMVQRRTVDRVQQYVDVFSQYKNQYGPASLHNSIIVHDSGVSSLSQLDQTTAGSHDVANSTARSDWVFARPTSPLLGQANVQNSILLGDRGKPETVALRNLATFLKDSQITFSGIKSVVESLFQGPRASLDNTTAKSIVGSAKRLNEIRRSLEQIHQSWMSSQAACRHDMRSRLVKAFWYVYYRDPDSLSRAVKSLEEMAESFQGQPTGQLTPPSRQPRCSLLDNLAN